METPKTQVSSLLHKNEAFERTVNRLEKNPEVCNIPLAWANAANADKSVHTCQWKKLIYIFPILLLAYKKQITGITRETKFLMLSLKKLKMNRCKRYKFIGKAVSGLKRRTKGEADNRTCLIEFLQTNQRWLPEKMIFCENAQVAGTTSGSVFANGQKNISVEKCWLAQTFQIMFDILTLSKRRFFFDTEKNQSQLSTTLTYGTFTENWASVKSNFIWKTSTIVPIKNIESFEQGKTYLKTEQLQ